LTTKFPGAQVLVLLAFFASTFAASVHEKAVEPTGPFDDLIEQIIDDILSQLTDPMPLNDTEVELIIEGLLLTSSTAGVSISGTSGIQVTDVTMGLLGNFVVKVHVPILIATGEILHHIQSHWVWPEPIFGEGPLEGHLLSLDIEVSGGLILIPIGVRNIDYKLSIGGVFLEQEGLMGGPQHPDHQAVKDNLNANGHTMIMQIESANHEYFRKLIEDAIGKSMKINH